MTLSTISEKDDGTDVAADFSPLIVVGDGAKQDATDVPKSMERPITKKVRANNSFERL